MLRAAKTTGKTRRPDAEDSSELSGYGDSAAAMDARRRTKRRRHTISTTSKDLAHPPTTNLVRPDTQVPRVARRFRDGCGRSIFMGDSATPSFLHNVRRLVQDLGGDSDFTTDPLRHIFLDLPTPSPAPWFPLSDVDPTWEQADILANQFLTATTCVLDFLNVQVLFRSIRMWLGGSVVSTGQGGEEVLSRPLLYLVMAIGAQASAEGMWSQMGEHYFAMGRQHAIHYDISDVSLEVVQIHILLAMYALGASRRHAAFMYLGTAVRAAHALGLHQYSLQDEPSSMRHDPYARTWQSLRMLDLFLSITLGRPIATSDCEENMPAFPCSTEEAGVSEDCMFALSVRRLCGIFEMILRDVYAKRVVSIASVDNISTHLRQWSENLPPLPPTNPLANGPTISTQSEMARAIASAHLIGAYHWSIILLTRPLLMSHVLRIASGGPSTATKVEDQDEKGLSFATAAAAYNADDICKYAIGSIHSAMHIVEIANDLMQYEDLPKRLPFVANSVFNAALVIGIAHFGEFDKTFPLTSLMDTVVRVLHQMSIYDEVSRRYAQVADYLRGAAVKFVHDRNNNSMQSSRRTMNDMFGAVGLSLKRGPAQNLSNLLVMPYGHEDQHRRARSVYSDMSLPLMESNVPITTTGGVGDATSVHSAVPSPIGGVQQDGHLSSSVGRQFLNAPEVLFRPDYTVASSPLTNLSSPMDQQVMDAFQQAENVDSIMSRFNVGNNIQ